MMPDFDDLLDEVGGFGPFQVTVFVLVSLFETPTAWAMFLHVFVAAHQPWTCENLLRFNSDKNWTGSGIFDAKTFNMLAAYGLSDSRENASTGLRVDILNISVEERCDMVLNNTCGRVIFSSEFTTIISEVRGFILLP